MGAAPDLPGASVTVPANGPDMISIVTVSVNHVMR